MKSNWRIFPFFCFLELLALPLFAHHHHLQEVSTLASKVSNAKNHEPTYYLNIAALKITEVIPPPPLDGTRDEQMREEAIVSSDRKKIKNDVTWDDVFSYNNVLGSSFNAEQAPLTAALFAQVDHDTRIAIRAAKHVFEKKRPMKSKGYTYPSGRSTEAFVMASLLSNLFPGEQAKLLEEAKKKAWSRVQLGDHYPSDDYAGEIYGKYLAQQFLANAAFQQKWAAVRKEVVAARK